MEEDGTAFDARTLSGSITDFASGAMRIGQSLNGKILSSENYLFDCIAPVSKNNTVQILVHVPGYMVINIIFPKGNYDTKAFFEPSKNTPSLYVIDNFSC